MSKQATCPCRVPLAQLAEQTGRTVESVEALALRYGFVVRGDWANRPSVSVDEAATLYLSHEAGLEAGRRAQEASQ